MYCKWIFQWEYQDLDAGSGTSNTNLRQNNKNSSVSALCFSHNKNYIACAYGDKGQLIIWDLNSRSIDFTLNGHNSTIYTIAASEDFSLIATGSNDKKVIVWDIYQRRKRCALEGHSEAVFSLKITRDLKTLISGSADETIIIWSIEQRNQID
jgi:WD40 repeat protein